MKYFPREIKNFFQKLFIKSRGKTYFKYINKQKIKMNSQNQKFTCNQIRKMFLNFFQNKGHQIVNSSSLVPHGDPTLLFTNAGMNQFKDVFLGFDKRNYSRATTAQKCVRAGGKHNDLENVGYTARHHTFFEMLGNFSFGDYFKTEAIHFAWELLTEVFKLPPEKLTATVYAEDDEAYEIWTKQIGLPPERVIRIGDNKGSRYASDNFWMMGDTGPCGPCSEIFYDHGEEIFGGPPGSPDEDGDRFIEIWNNVFMQFNRDENGVMHKLPRPSVDTGMGLERITAVLQGVHSNYEIDLFQNLIAAAAKITNSKNDLNNPSLKVLADHIRACAFLIADGVIAGNEGRGFVLRRIIRRAVRHGYKLGCQKPFFYKLVDALCVEMGEAYPQLIEQQSKIKESLLAEETRFFATLANGMEILNAELNELQNSTRNTKLFSGEVAFKLHDTYGFPLDLTEDVCRESNVKVDEVAFNTAMEEQKNRARAAGKFKVNLTQIAYNGEITNFEGYETLNENAAKITALYKDGLEVDCLNEGEVGVIVLDKTPFYAESGGQVGDIGIIKSADGIFEVQDTQKIRADVFGHHGVVKTGKISKNIVNAAVDIAARQATMRNHSATHLMHKALRQVLGTHVQQKGSLVDSRKTRFDFLHDKPMTDEQIAAVELLVNQEILQNQDTICQIMPLAEAEKSGAMMLFGEKYGETVRVLSIGTSKEFCGGTHVKRVGDIGLFKIVSETGVAAGIRRVEAITGLNALNLLQKQTALINELSSNLLKTSAEDLPNKIAALQQQIKADEKEISKLKTQLALANLDDLLNTEKNKNSTRNIKNIFVLSQVFGDENTNINDLRQVADLLKDKREGVFVLAAANKTDSKISLVVGISKTLNAQYKTLKAGDLANFIAQQIGGKGGGRPDFAQAGGNNLAALNSALQSVFAWVEEKI